MVGVGARDRLTAAEKARFTAETGIGKARAAERTATGAATELAAEQKVLTAILKGSDDSAGVPAGPRLSHPGRSRL